MRKEKNIHSGHRARMRERFRTQGADGLSPHEMLEMLLYFAIPQKDTNPLAHELLDTFGGLRAVLKANPELLRHVSGMTNGVVSMLSFLRALYQRTILENVRGTRIRTMEDAISIFRSIIQFEQSEQLWIAFLDEELCVRDIVLFSDQAETCVSVDSDRLTADAKKLGVSTVIMMHNHLSTSAEPSNHDVEMTRRAVYCLDQYAIYVLDHLISTDTAFYSLRSHGYFSDIQKM